MNNVKNIAIVALLVIVVAVVIVAKQGRRKTAAALSPRESVVVQPATAESALPRMVDLGADKCVPCKMMAPILEELKTAHAGKVNVEFIDVWKNAGAGQEYGIRVIPTQIFFSPDGKELARHEGFMSKEDVLAKWRELGMLASE